MDGSVFGPHRRERIVFLGKFGDTRLGRLKKGFGCSQKAHFCEKSAKMDGANASLDRTGVSGSLFLQKTAKHGLAAVKQGRGAANQCILWKKALTTLQNGMGGFVFGPHRRERIAFCGKFGGARLGRAVKNTNFRRNTEKWTGRMRVWTAQV